MHTTIKKCGCKIPCGCKDVGLTTPPPPPCETGTEQCPTPEPCAEIFDSRCVAWMGDPIVDLDIQKGDRLSEVIQKLVLLSTNSGCVLPTAACQSVLNLMSITKSSTTITVGWSASPSATQYTVEYKEASVGSFTLNTPVVPPVVTNTIGGLIPDTDYHIRVNTTCSSGSCYSLTILVRTNPA